MLEFLCGVGGGFFSPELDEPDGDLLMGDPRFPGGRGGGGGVGPPTGAGGGGGGGGGAGKPALFSEGGGGKSVDWSCWLPPGCHFGLVLTAGGERGGLGSSAGFTTGKEAPGN